MNILTLIPVLYLTVGTLGFIFFDLLIKSTVRDTTSHFSLKEGLIFIVLWPIVFRKLLDKKEP